MSHSNGPGGQHQDNHYTDERYIELVTNLQQEIDSPHFGVAPEQVAEEFDVAEKTARGRLRMLAQNDDLRVATSVLNLHKKGYRSDEEPDKTPSKRIPQD